jgi:hypothetical protein
MALGDLTDRDAVLTALGESDELGRDAFLAKYGFGRAKHWMLVVDGRAYDSKAIAAAAHGFQHPDLGPLRASDFSGGQQTVVRKLRELGFEVIDRGATALSRFWWVNQGATWKEERDGGFVWAPLRSQGGLELGHWKALNAVEIGDRIFHYANGALRAIGVARRGPEVSPKPSVIEHGPWEQDGRLVRVEYSELAEPVPLADIPERWRIEQGAPFTRTGSVQQGYFYGLDETFVERLVGRFPQLAAVLTDVSSELRNQDVSVAEAFESFRESVEHSGLIVDPVLLRSFFCSLLAKPFVILTGLSGSGKTQLALKLGNWFGVDSDGRARSVVVPVRPDWTGPEPLLGYEDALSGAEHGEHAWAAPDVLQFLLRAEDDPAHPYVLVLDEMNLAHVERYFADFLSGIESRQPILPNLTRSAAGDWRLTPGEPKRIPIPPNVFVVGTVNVDETTYLFSPKVLDRANSFEFRVLTDDLGTVGGRPTAATEGGDLELRQVLAVVSDDDWHVRAPHPAQAELADRLRGLHRLLAVSGHEFGHRVYGEGLRFAALLAGSGEDDLDTALDLFTMQKALPRLHGARRRIEPVLGRLAAFAATGHVADPPPELDPPTFAEAPALPRTFDKVRRMLESVRINQFVSFAE